MALPKIIDSLTDVDESLREHYTPVDPEKPESGFELGLKGDTGKQKVNEFRTHNVSLQKENGGLKSERDALIAKLAGFEGIDPEKHKKAMDALNQIESSEELQLIKDGKLDEVVERRTAQMREHFTSDMKAKTDAYSVLDKKHATLVLSHSRMLIGSAVQKEIASSGVKVRGTALEDILSRTHRIFKLRDDGKMVAMDGDSPIHGPTGDALTMKDHINNLTSDSAHLFEGSGGGGANGSDGSGSRKTPGGGKLVIDPNDHKLVGQHLKDLNSGKAVFAKQG